MLREIAAGSGQRLAVSLDRKDGSRAEVERSFESYDPLRDPSDAALALSGVRADHDRLRQVLHLLHRAAGPRPGAKPAPRHTSWPRPASWPTEGCREITLLGQTVNSYRHTADGRTTRLSDLLDRLHDIDGLERIKFVTNFPKDMTDDLLRGGPRPAQGARRICTCRPRAARTTC